MVSGLAAGLRVPRDSSMLSWRRQRNEQVVLLVALPGGYDKPCWQPLCCTSLNTLQVRQVYPLTKSWHSRAGSRGGHYKSRSKA